MNWKEIEQRFKDEWVLVEVTQASEDYEIVEGEVLCHDPDEDRFRKQVDPLHPKEFAIRYIGEPPTDWAVML